MPSTSCARGIVVCYAAEENAVSVAEHVFALLLALARKIPAADRSVRDGRWERAAHTGFELHGKTMAVLGARPDRLPGGAARPRLWDAGARLRSVRFA